jgi:hypothetical protein
VMRMGYAKIAPGRSPTRPPTRILAQILFGGGRVGERPGLVIATFIL